VAVPTSAPTNIGSSAKYDFRTNFKSGHCQIQGALFASLRPLTHLGGREDLIDRPNRVARRRTEIVERFMMSAISSNALEEAASSIKCRSAAKDQPCFVNFFAIFRRRSPSGLSPIAPA
jgi:hypothetical protein